MKNDLWVGTGWSETWAKGVSTINGSSEFMGIVCVLNGIHLSSGLQRTHWVWFEVFVSWQYNKCPCRISWSDSLCCCNPSAPPWESSMEYSSHRGLSHHQAQLVKLQNYTHGRTEDDKCRVLVALGCCWYRVGGKKKKLHMRGMWTSKWSGPIHGRMSLAQCNLLWDELIIIKLPQSLPAADEAGNMLDKDEWLRTD